MPALLRPVRCKIGHILGWLDDHDRLTLEPGVGVRRPKGRGPTLAVCVVCGRERAVADGWEVVTVPACRGP